MANEICNYATMVFVDSLNYGAIFAIWYSFSKHSDKYRILNFIRGFLDGNEIDKTIFWERLKILEKEGKTISKLSR